MSHNFIVVNGDTDSISFKKPDHSPFSNEERKRILDEINSIMPKLIIWNDDNFYKKFIVVGAKNYIMLDEKDKLVIKGSALKASNKEKALKEFITKVIQLLVHNNQNLVHELYLEYAKEILRIKDISRWCSKHTITKAVLTGKETTQVRIREALKGKPVQEGDKVYQFVKTEGVRCLEENFDGTYDVKTLLAKLYDTVCVFDSVLDVKAIPDLSKKKNQGILNGLRQNESENTRDCRPTG